MQITEPKSAGHIINSYKWMHTHDEINVIFLFRLIREESMLIYFKLI